MLQNLRRALTEARRDLGKLSADKRLEVRYQRLMAYGKYKETARR
jgi:acetyl-CoA carboxylase alpha subunit